MTARRAMVAAGIALALAAPRAPAAREAKEGKGKIPVTTRSEEARAQYLEGRAAFEQLRITDAREHYRRAVEADPGFALAHLALAQSAATAQEFFDGVAVAVRHAGTASEGERRQILFADANVRGDVAAQREHATRLVALFPGDERAQSLLGGFHFGRQEYEAAVAAYRKAIAVNPRHAFAYNQLGYAYRFLERYPEAEQAFRKYVELIPGEPNPYDSQAELLLRMGRFDEAIAAYEKALAIDPRFVASYVGIASAHVFAGRGEEARATLQKLRGVARNDGELRQAEFWTAVSWLHEGATDRALEAMRAEYAIAERSGDAANMAQDVITMGQILLHAGQHDRALAEFERAVAIAEAGKVPPEVKENVRRNHLFFAAWTAIARGDLATGRARAEAYRAEALKKAIPFEVRRTHELAGQLALAGKDGARAVTELRAANQQDPYVLTLLARAYQASGDAKKARATWKKAAEWNQLSFPYAFVRAEARRAIAASG
jgi:tetratricopeptide (TPR) repeat protein